MLMMVTQPKTTVSKAFSRLSGPASTQHSKSVVSSGSLMFMVERLILQIIYSIMSVVLFVIYQYHRLKLRLLMITYHHNRTPQLIRNDVAALAKIPKHLAVILKLKETDEEGGGIDGLLEQAGELSAWCIGAGIEVLTIYESSGALKKLPSPDVYRAISRRLESYFGIAGRPSFQLVTPHIASSYVNGNVDENPPLKINLLSRVDGRETLVDLSRTLADLAVQRKITADVLDIDIIDKEMKTLVTDEPDLLIQFGPSLVLDGFPPWQIRLSEIYYQPDNDQVSYVVFLKALQKYAGAKFNVGR